MSHPGSVHRGIFSQKWRGIEQIERLRLGKNEKLYFWNIFCIIFCVWSWFWIKFNFSFFWKWKKSEFFGFTFSETGSLPPDLTPVFARRDLFPSASLNGFRRWPPTAHTRLYKGTSCWPQNREKPNCGQSYKASKIVIYESRVVIMRNLLVITIVGS